LLVIVWAAENRCKPGIEKCKVDDEPDANQE
jgi:hypothetical protein